MQGGSDDVDATRGVKLSGWDCFRARAAPILEEVNKCIRVHCIWCRRVIAVHELRLCLLD
jgi:hypothetical protein